MFSGSGLKTKSDTGEVSSIYFQQYQIDSVAEKALAAADAVGDVLTRTFHPRDACDVGCGGGALIRALVRRGVDAVGIEGSVFAHELLPDRISLHDLRSEWEGREKYDLVTSFDVAEHVEPEYADTFVRTLSQLTAPWGWIVLGPAPEGQDGLGHVNCQHPTYWIAKLQAHGFGLFAQMSELVRKEIRADERHSHLWWIAKNLMVFARVGMSHSGRLFTSEEQWRRSLQSKL